MTKGGKPDAFGPVVEASPVEDDLVISAPIGVGMPVMGPPSAANGLLMPAAPANMPAQGIRPEAAQNAPLIQPLNIAPFQIPHENRKEGVKEDEKVDNEPIITP